MLDVYKWAFIEATSYGHNVDNKGYPTFKELSDVAKRINKSSIHMDHFNYPTGYEVIESRKMI